MKRLFWQQLVWLSLTKFFVMSFSGEKKKKSQDNFDYPVKKKVYSALLWEKKKKKVYKLPNNRGKINK